MSAEKDVIEAPEGDAVQSDAPSIEDRAKEMGWRPIEDFKGDKSLFIDAETFVKRGEEFVPFLKASNRKMEKALEASRAEMADLKKTLDTVSSQLPKLAQREYARALADLEARQSTAAENGDVEGVKEATKAIVALEKDAADGKKAPAPAGAITDEQFEAWTEENTWFKTDAAMRGAAIAIADELAAQKVTGKAQLAEVAKRIKAEFPHKFENPRRREAALVAAPTPNRSSGGKSWSDLPPEAKASWQDFQKLGVKITKEKYAEGFDWEGYKA